MASNNLIQLSTDIMKLDLFDGGSFKRWQKKPWLNPVNVSSSEMTISFDVATSSMLCRIHSWTYIKIIPVLANFGKFSRNASSRKTQQVRNLLFLSLTYNTGRYLAQNKYAKVIGNLIKPWDYGLEYSGDPSVLEVSWGSKKQSCLTDFTMAAEVVALASCYKEAEWLRDLLINIPL
ncbi:hypothetical protein Tco_0866885 [Tanacetum coccineum]